LPATAGKVARRCGFFKAAAGLNGAAALASLTLGIETGKLAARRPLGVPLPRNRLSVSAAPSVTSPDDPLEAARAVLAPGETLVWADRPHPRALARAQLPQAIRGALGLAVIGGFLWLSFLPNWPGGLRGLLLAGFLLAAALYALWLLAAPLVARAAAGRTVYAVTDRRVLTLEDWPFRRLRAFTAAELDETMVVPAEVPGEADGGSVAFIHRKRPWWRRSAGGSYQIEAFYGIAEARRVAGRIDALKAAAAAPPPDEDL
jgi:hypothetical protein